MAQKLTTVIELEISGVKQSVETVEQLADLVNKAREAASKGVKLEFDAGESAKKTEQQIFNLTDQLAAVEKLGFGKALKQGFIEGEDQIKAVTESLRAQFGEATKGTAAYAAISSNLEAAQKELDKFAKAEEKAAKDRAKAEAQAAKEAAAALEEQFKQALSEKGFAGAFAEGTIDSFKDIEKAFFILQGQLKKAEIGGEGTEKLKKDFLDAKAAVTVFGAEFEKAGATAETSIKNISTTFIDINQETGKATLNTEELNKQYKQLDKSIQEVSDNTEELSREFQKLTIPELKTKLNETSRTQLEKELKGLEELFKGLEPGTAAFDEVQEKIRLVGAELEKEVLPSLTELSLAEVKFAVSKRSKEQLEADLAEVDALFKSLAPGDEGYDEARNKLKLVKQELLDIETSTEVIKGIDLSQAYIDLATKTTEGFANASTAIGSFTGAVGEAEQITAEFEKALQLLAVVQSVQDGFKAFQETLKGTNASAGLAAGGLKVLRFALAATGIGAVVLALILLVEQFGGIKKVLEPVIDAFAGLKRAFGALPKFISDNSGLILDTLKSLGLSIATLLSVPLNALFRFGQAIKDIFSGKGIAESFKQAGKDLIQPFVDTFENGKKLFDKAGKELGDAFAEGFDISRRLRENERAKVLLETLNAERAARKSALDNQLADERKSFAERRKLLIESAALQRASVADELALNRERADLLTRLGKQITDEQKDELKDLKATIAQQAADLENLARDTAQALRDIQVAEQEDRLAIAQLNADKQVAILQNQLARQVELQNISAEEERKTIEEIFNFRRELLLQEEEAIKARGQLTRDEERRLIEISNERTAIQQEQEQTLRDAVQRRFDQEIALAELKAEKERVIQELTFGTLEAQQRAEARRVAAAERELALQEKTLNSFKDIAKFRETSEENIRASEAAQVSLLEQQLALDKAALDLERQSLESQIASIEARKTLRDLTAEELAQLELLDLQLQKIDKSAAEIELTFELDKKDVAQQSADALNDLGETLKTQAKEKIADPLGSALREALTNGLKITNEDAQGILDSLGGLKEAALGLIGEINAIQIESLQAEKERIDAQIAEQDAAITDIQTRTSEALQSIDELEGQLAESRGERQSAILAQLEGQKKLQSDLALQAKKAEDEKKRLQAEADKRDAEIAKKEKEQAKINLAIATAEAFAQGAIGVAQAFQAPPPLGLISGIAAIATIIGAITSLLQLARFRDGGVVPKAARGRVLRGPSHAEGGILLTVGGRPTVEAEGGEIVLTKGVAANPALAKTASDLNVAGGGVPLFQSGGAIPSLSADAGDAFGKLNEFDQRFEANQQAILALANRPAQVAVTDIAAGQNRVTVIDEASTF